MKTLDIERIRLWTENRDRQCGGHAWHLERVELVDNSWYKDGIHVRITRSSSSISFLSQRRFYNFNANQWIMDNEIELRLAE